MRGFLHHEAQSIFQRCGQRLDFGPVEQAAVFSRRNGFEKDSVSRGADGDPTGQKRREPDVRKQQRSVQAGEAQREGDGVGSLHVQSRLQQLPNMTNGQNPAAVPFGGHAKSNFDLIQSLRSVNLYHVAHLMACANRRDSATLRATSMVVALPPRS